MSVQEYYNKGTGTFGPIQEDCNDCSDSYTTGYTNGVVPSFTLETIRSSEIDDLPRIKARLEKLEQENTHMRLQNKILKRKIDYWRGQSAELAELRKIKYSISKDKSKTIIRALKRGIS